MKGYGLLADSRAGRSNGASDQNKDICGDGGSKVFSFLRPRFAILSISSLGPCVFESGIAGLGPTTGACNSSGGASVWTVVLGVEV